MNNSGKHQSLLSLKRSRGIIFFLLSLLSLNHLLLPRAASAEGLGGYLEFNYSDSATKTEDQTGETTKIKSGTFNQIYNLSFQKTIYPNIFLNTGGIFSQDTTRSDTDGDITTSSITNMRPFVDLTLRNQTFLIGGRYNIREEKTTGTDLRAITNVNENYDAIFGWDPEGLPSIDLRYERSNLYDRDRLSRDTVTDFVSMTARYMPEYGPLQGLDIQYQPSYRKLQDKLDDIVTTTLSQNGRVTYSDTFFNRRVSLFTSYNVAHTETEVTTSTQTGEVSTQLFPFSGLSAIDDTPSSDALSLNSALIDGNLTQNAGINIGVPPFSGNTDQRNIGLDFAAATEVNNIFIWVDRELPAAIANAFKWDVYTSPDNRTWTFLATIPAASFGPFQNRFDINFSNVTTRYIKVVTIPLTTADTIGVTGDFSDILVTEIQAFLKTPAGTSGKHVKDSRTNSIYNLDVRTRILDVPILYYEFSYFFTKAASVPSDFTLSNGFSLTHSFSSVISTQARVAREDVVQNKENGVNYLYNASVTARPLKTLTHTLNYSGISEELGGEKSTTNSVFLNNIAELYKGLNVNLNGGASLETKDTGEKTTNTIYSVGSGIVPHRRVTIDLYYSSADTKQTGAGQEDSTDVTKRGTFSVSYKPFDTVYLFVSFETIKTSDKTSDLQNYGVNWAPFPDGSLQCAFSYNESLTSDGDKIRLINPNIRWNISSKTFLDLSTQFLKSEAVTQKSDSVVSSATFRTVF
ncbi:MAG: hypothetical protein HZB61_16100 [Nitrospirae bacterium]|nr:hypothetical protein [Nitrospirota bacterium]